MPAVNNEISEITMYFEKFIFFGKPTTSITNPTYVRYSNIVINGLFIFASTPNEIICVWGDIKQWTQVLGLIVSQARL